MLLQPHKHNIIISIQNFFVSIHWNIIIITNIITSKTQKVLQ